MARSYSMRGVLWASDRAVELARAYLLWREPKSRLHDVSLDPRFQQRGVDLLWEPPDGRVLGVEVKGDRHARRGNYFLELISNLEKDTPGCFLYTEADLLLYVFLDPREVHVLPMPATREWFLPRASRFEVKHTRTRAGQGFYTTLGAVVPVARVLEEVAGVGRHRFAEEGFTSLPPRR